MGAVELDVAASKLATRTLSHDTPVSPLAAGVVASPRQIWSSSSLLPCSPLARSPPRARSGETSGGVGVVELYLDVIPPRSSPAHRDGAVGAVGEGERTSGATVARWERERE